MRGRVRCLKEMLAPAGWRVLADAVIALASLGAGFAVRFWIALFEPSALTPHLLWPVFRAEFLKQGPLLAGVLVAANALFGVYTRTRFYTRRSKAVALFQSISLAYAAFVLLTYILGRPGGSVPRGTFLIAYVVTLAGGMGSRLAKDYLGRRFTLERVERQPQRAIRKALVVGGAGYIGSVLVRDLLAAGYKVRVLDSLASGDDSIRELYGTPAFELITGDFRRVEPVVRAAKGMDAVIHLGAIVGDPACAVDEDETLETNLAATRLLADVCRASGVSRILFASTCSVYGAADQIVDERSRLNPVSLYAATKTDSEKVLLGARDRHFHPVILRLATAFGWSWRPRFDLVVNLLAAGAAVDNKIRICNAEQWRPLIHVADIARAFRLALEAPLEVVSGEIFNVGSNSMNLTLREMAERLARLRPGLAVEYVHNTDARNYRVSFDKARDRLRLDCQVSLEQGVAEIWEALSRGLVEDYRDPRYSNVQLASLRRREQEQNACHGREDPALTALQFARNSRWWRAISAGTPAEALLGPGTSSLGELARVLEADAAAGSGAASAAGGGGGAKS